MPCFALVESAASVCLPETPHPGAQTSFISSQALVAIMALSSVQSIIEANGCPPPAVCLDWAWQLERIASDSRIAVSWNDLVVDDDGNLQLTDQAISNLAGPSHEKPSVLPRQGSDSAHADGETEAVLPIAVLVEQLLAWAEADTEANVSTPRSADGSSESPSARHESRLIGLTRQFDSNRPEPIASNAPAKASSHALGSDAERSERRTVVSPISEGGFRAIASRADSARRSKSLQSIQPIEFASKPTKDQSSTSTFSSNRRLIWGSLTSVCLLLGLIGWISIPNDDSRPTHGENLAVSGSKLPTSNDQHVESTVAAGSTEKAIDLQLSTTERLGELEQERSAGAAAGGAASDHGESSRSGGFESLEGLADLDLAGTITGDALPFEASGTAGAVDDTRDERGERRTDEPASKNAAQESAATSDSEAIVTSPEEVDLDDAELDRQKFDVMAELERVNEKGRDDSEEVPLPVEVVRDGERSDGDLRLTDQPALMIATSPMRQVKKLDTELVRSLADQRLREPRWRLRIELGDDLRVTPTSPQTITDREVARWVIEDSDAAEATAAQIVVAARLNSPRTPHITWQIVASGKDLPQVTLPLSRDYLVHLEQNLEPMPARIDAEIERLRAWSRTNGLPRELRSQISSARRYAEQQVALAKRLLELVATARQMDGWLDSQLQVHAELFDASSPAPEPLLRFGNFKQEANRSEAHGDAS
jgi:hypothetical protein